MNQLRTVAADAVRADHQRRWLIVTSAGDEPSAFTTDDPRDVLGHGAAVVTVVPLTRLDTLLERARAAA